MRKQRKGPKFTIEDKNKIVLLYLDRHMGRQEIVTKFSIPNKSMLHRWINQYKEFGTCVDRRGKATKKDNPKIGRPRKYNVNLEELSKEQLIEKIKMYEDIKKSMAYLVDQQQN